VFVEVRRDGPGTVILVEEEDHAFTDVDEEADGAAASVEVMLVLRVLEGRGMLDG
jgi:hypothetical protein